MDTSKSPYSACVMCLTQDLSNVLHLATKLKWFSFPTVVKQKLYLR